MTRIDRHEVVVIGGGQAGMAMAWHLARQGRRFCVLEAAATPAAAWVARWDSLRLFTPARYSSLPGMPFPGDPDAHPGRDDVVAYLTEYARRFALPVELDSRVTALRRADDGAWAVELDGRICLADQVVVATGPFQTPVVPAAANGLDESVAQLHASAYRRPADLPDGTVLVVGGGNTGFQIAEELVRSRAVHLAIGSRQLPLPQRVLGQDVFRRLDALGAMRVTAGSRLGRRLRDRETLIGSSPRRARRLGVRLHPRVRDAAGRAVAFADGSTQTVDAVVWATGYARDHGWIDAPVHDARGAVRHERGVTPAGGLYVLGMPWQHTRGSALLGWVGEDAAYLAERIAAYAASRPPRRAAMPA